MAALIPVLWLLFGIGAAIAASNKGRSGFIWFFIGVLLGPFGLLFALLVSEVKPKPRFVPDPISSIPDELCLDHETRLCPFCAEPIKLAAIKCKHCGEHFDPVVVDKLIADRQSILKENVNKISEGKKQCPQCGSWDVRQGFLGDGSFGDWCPHCKRPIGFLTPKIVTDNF